MLIVLSLMRGHPRPQLLLLRLNCSPAWEGKRANKLAPAWTAHEGIVTFVRVSEQVGQTKFVSLVTGARQTASAGCTPVSGWWPENGNLHDLRIGELCVCNESGYQRDSFSRFSLFAAIPENCIGEE